MPRVAGQRIVCLQLELLRLVVVVARFRDSIELVLEMRVASYL
jgi:hypothetical protein